ncbi:MAG: hypothetical protein IPK24_20335 [Kineosporiaceae bacterium]|nr:hypothetical protein [Kineosporiaceae bacterium]
MSALTTLPLRTVRLAALGLVLTATSLGLHWATSTTSGGVIPGYYVPDSYVIQWDEGTVDTVPGFVGAPIFTQGTSYDLSGAETPARLWLVCALVVAALALRTGRPGLLRVAALGPLLAVPLAGLHVYPGKVVALAGAAMLLVAGLSARRRAPTP